MMLLNETSGSPASISLLDVVRAGRFTGVCEIPNSLYHASPGLSSSNLPDLEKAPALFRYKKLNPETEESASQRLGTLTHLAVLEEDVFNSRVVIRDGVWRGDLKKEVAELKAQGFYVCKSEERDLAFAMAESIRKHPWAKRLLTEGEQEKSVFAHHPVFGFLMKCRPDAVHVDKRIIADLKTYTDLDDWSLDKQIKRMKYDWKAAFYLDVCSVAYGVSFKKFAHIFVSTDPPHLVRVVALGSASMERASTMVAPLMLKYAQCLESNEWPGYPEDVEDFELYIL